MTATSAADGCTIVSAPGCRRAENDRCDRAMTTGSSAPVRYVFLLLLALLALASCAREPQRPLMSPLESGTPWWDNYGYRERSFLETASRSFI